VRKSFTPPSPFFINQGDTASGYETASLGIDSGFSGLIPMILGKAAVGRSNEVFKNAVPDLAIGRTVIARHSQSGLLLIAVQPHHNRVAAYFGGSGYSLDALLDKLVAAGADDAVSSDGSDSVFVNYRKAWVFRPSDRKDQINITAIGFSYDP
jgi:hypothetical protein